MKLKFFHYFSQFIQKLRENIPAKRMKSYNLLKASKLN